MTPAIVDTGPLVARLNRRDERHDWEREAISPPRPRIAGGPEAVLALVERGALLPDFSLAAEIAAVRRLLSSHADAPMSLADACLVRMAERATGSRVITLDRGFLTYRCSRSRPVPVVLPPDLASR